MWCALPIESHCFGRWLSPRRPCMQERIVRSRDGFFPKVGPPACMHVRAMD